MKGILFIGACSLLASTESIEAMEIRQNDEFIYQQSPEISNEQISATFQHLEQSREHTYPPLIDDSLAPNPIRLIHPTPMGPCPYIVPRDTVSATEEQSDEQRSQGEQAHNLAGFSSERMSEQEHQ